MPVPRLVVILAFLLMWLPGCWERREGPQIVDLAGQNSEVEQTVHRLELVETTVDEELDALDGLVSTFFDTPADAWAPPFPFDAFRHAAMSCLNEPSGQSDAEPLVREAADRLKVSCAPPAILSLDTELVTNRDRRAFAREKIGEVDQIRTLRHAVQARLRQLPDLIQRTQNYLAIRRSEARQMEADVDRRRAEYTRGDYQAALERIDQHRERLDSLERVVTGLEAKVPAWRATLEGITERAYKRLSRLGR